MPKVPDNTPQASLNVPGVNAPYTREFGKLGEAEEQAGAKVEGTGLNLFQTVQEANAKNTAQQAYFGDKIASEQKLIELKNNSPDGFIHSDTKNPTWDNIVLNDDHSQRTIAQEYQAWADDRYRSNQDKMPNDLSNMIYRTTGRQYFSEQTAMLTTESQAMHLSAFKQDQANQTRQLGDQLVSNPNLFNMYMNMNDIAANHMSQVGVLFNQNEAKAEIQQKYQSVSRDFMEGGVDQIRQMKKVGDPSRQVQIDYYKSVLNGEDSISQARSSRGMPTVSNTMDPIQKAAELRRLTQLEEGESANLDMTDHKIKLENYISSAKRGEQSAGGGKDLLSEMVEYAKKGVLTPGQVSQETAGIYAAQVQGILRGGGFDLASQASQKSQMQSALTEVLNRAQGNAKFFGPIYSEDLGKQIASAAQSNILTHLQDIEGQKQKDWASFIQGSDTGPGGRDRPRLDSAFKFGQLNHDNIPGLANSAGVIQSYLAQNKAYYANNYGHNMNFYQPISTDQASKYVGQFTSQSEGQCANNVENLKKAYGSDYPAVVNQMFKNGLPETYRAGFSAESYEQSKAVFMSAKIDNKELEQAVTQVSTQGRSFSEYQKAATLAVKDDVNAMLQGSGDMTYNKIVNGIVPRMIKVASGMQQQSGGTMSDDDAFAAAKKIVLKGYPETIQNVGATGGFLGIGSHGGKFSLQVPPGLSDDQKKVIEHNVIQATEPENLSKLPIIKPAALPNAANFPQIVNGTRQILFVQGGPHGPGYIVKWQNINKDTGKPDGILNDLLIAGGTDNKNGPNATQQFFLPLKDMQRSTPDGTVKITPRTPTFQPGQR